MSRKKILYNITLVIILGFIIKGIALIQKVIMTRMLGVDGISLYSYIMPTLGLFIALSQFGLGTAITKYITKSIIKKPYSNRSIMIKSFIFSSLISIFLILVLIFSAKTISINLLNNKDLYYPLLSIIPLIPLTSYTGILKGYLNAYQKIDKGQISNLIEQIFHFISMVLLLISYKEQTLMMVIMAIISISIGELSSLIYLIYQIKKQTKFLPFKFNLKLKEFNQILEVALPGTSIRIIGNVCYFFEPIIFTLSLLKINLTKDEITLLYGSINGLAIPLLLMCSFITFSISSMMIPYITEAYAKKDQKKLFKIFNNVLFASSYFALIGGILLTFYSYEFMNLLYKTVKGAKYVEYMALPFIFYYFEHPLSVAMHTIDKSKSLFIINLLINLLKLITIYFLCQIPLINAHGLTFSLLISILITTLCYYTILSKTTGYKIKINTILKYISLIIILFVFKYLIDFINLNFLIKSLILIIIISFTMLLYYKKNQNKFIN